jgi:hypothetical protein
MTLDLDPDTSAPNTYEARQASRKERLLSRAAAARERAQNRFQAAHGAVAGIPMGQPILVGHHSEARHRGAIARADRAMRDGVDASEQAERLEQAAASVGAGGISSDDPSAAEQIRVKVARLEKTQARDKAINAAIRKAGTDDSKAIAAIVAILLPESEQPSERLRELASGFLRPDFAGRVGVPAYVLQNRNAEIRRLRERLEGLEARAADKTSEREIGSVRIEDNVEENRIRLFFPTKPGADLISRLKSAGWRWSPTVGAWQRMRGNAATYSAEQIAAAFGG